MKVTVRDERVLASIDPEDARTYLHWLGWEEIQFLPNRLSVWAPSDPHADAARIPLNTEFRDYSQSIARMLVAIESVTGKGQLDILNEITLGNKDVVEVKKDTPSVEDGTIPIREARELIQHGYDLMLAGASSAANHQPVYYSSKPTEATRFMDEVRMGQTKRGSFILTFLAPVPAVLFNREQARLEANTPFSRVVTETLARSLQVAQEIGEESLRKDDLNVFRDGVKIGVSANLCEAVVGLQERGGGAVQFDFDWSKGRPKPTNTPSQTVITPDVVPRLKEASQFLRTRVSKLTEVRGFVLTVGRRETHQKGGWVVVQANINGRFRAVRFDLPEKEESEAAQAFDTYRPIEVRGVLQVSGAMFILMQAQDFRVLEASEYDAGEPSTYLVEDFGVSKTPKPTNLSLFSDSN